MRKKVIPKIGITIFFLSISLLPAQDYNWNISLANGDTVSNGSLLNLSGDSLLITSIAEMKWISINSIISMTQIRKSKLADGLVLGLVAGGATGAAIGYASYEKPKNTSSESFSITIDLGPAPYVIGGGLIGGVVGMIVGATIGDSAGGIDVYDLSQVTYEEKVKIIESNLSK